MSKPTMNKQLGFCYDLAGQCYNLGPEYGGMKPWTTPSLVSCSSLSAPQLAALVEQLKAEASRKLWYSPRQSWALAHVAYTLAQELDQPIPLAQSSLVLAVSLNTLGSFAEVVPLLQPAVDLFLNTEQPGPAARCYLELALANLYLDDFEAVHHFLDQSHQLSSNIADPLLNAHRYRVEGLLYLVQNRYKQAAQIFQQALLIFTDAKKKRQIALVRCDLADTLLYTDPYAALTHLEQARNIPDLPASPVHTARCDSIEAFVCTKLNRYEDSLPLYRRAWFVFDQEGMRFLAARCDLDRGIAHYRLNQYQVALHLYRRARTAFAALGLKSRMAMCDLNTGNVYYDLNHYPEALALYERVAESALAEGRLLRAARCHTNMGLCYKQLGRYDKALLLHKRAQQAFLAGGDWILAALSQENLAETYSALGRYDQALHYYRLARDTFTRNHLWAHTAYCGMQIAELLLILGRQEEARRCLTESRRLYSEAGMSVHQAACDRRLALVAQAEGKPEEALSHLNQARWFFTALAMPVELALCDLAEGKVKLALAEVKQAQMLFQQAQATLLPGLPDQGWPAIEGLALCALIQGNRQEALHHYRLAINLISQARNMLSTEQLSSDFFAGRRYIFHAAVDLALDLGAVEEALEIVEVSKAQSFLSPSRLWEMQQNRQDDPYLTHLIEQAEDLRRQVKAARTRLMAAKELSEPFVASLRGAKETTINNLVNLNKAYDEIIEQLRLAAPSTEAHFSTFSVTEFRQAAAAHLGDNWVCLEYFLVEDKLLIFYLDPQTIKVYPRHLSHKDHWILQQCTSTEPERRELIYNGTLRGFSVPDKSGQIYRQKLHEILLPPDLLSASSWNLLILVPHSILHNLPFHALLENQSPLLEQGAVSYVPSLQVLQALWQQPGVNMSDFKPLVCGLDLFGERASTLPNAGQEVQAVAAMFGRHTQLFSGPQATVANLKQMSAVGDLAQYNLLHFVTHTVTEPETPLLSRVLLADDDLTVTDILELNLSARLVTLSSCQSAVGNVKPGDEMMTLARAFFHAGAQAVVASLWPVEDEATAILMQNFYQRLQAGDSISQALRQAQLMMRRAGYTPYQWAPFVVMGRS